MIVDTVLLEKGLKAAFNMAMTGIIMDSGAGKALAAITSILPSEGEDEKYGFLGDIPVPIKQSTAQDASRRPGSMAPLSWEGTNYQVGSIPLQDAGHRPVGRMIVMHDVTAQAAAATLTRLTTALACVIAWVVLVLFCRDVIRKAHARQQLAW